MIDTDEYKIKKKAVISLVSGIVVLLILLISATYAFFSMGVINNFGSKNLTARAGNLGSVVLSGSHASLSMSLTKADMTKDNNDITYYASTSGKTTTPTEVTFGSAIANSGQDSVSNDTYTTYHCEYTIHATHSVNGDDEDYDNDLYYYFKSDDYASYASSNQIILSINGIDYDFNNGWQEYINGSFELSTIAAKSLTAGFKFVNRSDIDQTDLSGKSIDIDIEVEKFECVPTGNLTELYWAFEPSIDEYTTASKSINKVSNYNNLNTVYVLSYINSGYQAENQLTQAECTSHVSNYDVSENPRCVYISFADDYELLIDQKVNYKTYSTQAACQTDLSNFDVSQNASCNQVNMNVFIKQYFSTQTEDIWQIYNYSQVYSEEDCITVSNYFYNELGYENSFCRPVQAYRSVAAYEDTYSSESSCYESNDYTYNYYCKYNDLTEQWNKYYFYNSYIPESLEQCNRENPDADSTCVPSVCNEKTRYVNSSFWFQTKDECLAYANSNLSLTSPKVGRCSYEYLRPYLPVSQNIEPDITNRYNTKESCEYNLYGDDYICDHNSQYWFRAGWVYIYADYKELALPMDYCTFKENVNQGDNNYRYEFNVNYYKVEFVPNSSGLYYTESDCNRALKNMRINNQFSPKCKLTNSNGTTYYEAYSFDDLPAKICISSSNNNVVCLPYNSWQNINTYKNQLELSGFTCNYASVDNLVCKNNSNIVNIFSNDNLYVSNGSIECKYENSNYSCVLQ